MNFLNKAILCAITEHNNLALEILLNERRKEQENTEIIATETSTEEIKVNVPDAMMYLNDYDSDDDDEKKSSTLS